MSSVIPLLDAKIAEVLARPNIAQFRSEVIANATRNLIEGWRGEELTGAYEYVQSWETSPDPTLQKAYAYVVKNLANVRYLDEEQQEKSVTFVDRAMRSDGYWQILKADFETNDVCKLAALRWKWLMKHHGEIFSQAKPELDLNDYFAVLKNRGYICCIGAGKSATDFFDECMSGLIRSNEERKGAGQVGPRQKTREEHALFLRSQEEAVLELRNMISEGADWEVVWGKVRLWRQELAVAQFQDDWKNFGKPRDCSLYSPVAGCNGKHLIEKIDAFINEMPRRKERDFHGIYAYAQMRTIYGELPGSEKVPLTILVRSDRPVNRLEYERIFKMHEIGTPAHIWEHADPDSIEKAMPHIALLYAKAKAAESGEAVLEAVARLHWWFCQATPCIRGSAAIMETISKAILEAKGLNLVVKEGVLIDIEALSEPNEEEFVRMYPSFYF